MKLFTSIIILKIILNQDIIEINSFETYKINKTENKYIFKYNNLSDNKTDIIIYISPYKTDKILGRLLISTDLDTISNARASLLTSQNLKIFYLNYENKKALTINSDDEINIGKGFYYIVLFGDISCELEIFLSNEIRDLSVNNSYYFPSISNMTSKYITSRINITDNSYFLNIFKNNKSCENIKIFENDIEIKCNEEISEYIKLNQQIYIINIFYGIEEDNIAINFLDHIIQNLSSYNNNIVFVDYSEINFLIELKKFDEIGVGIDYNSECEIELFYLDEYVNVDKIIDFDNLNYIDYNQYFIENAFLIKNNKENISYVIIKMTVKKYNNLPLKIDLYNDIYNINKLPYNSIISNNKSLFYIDDELKEYYSDIENYFVFKYDKKNSMKIYTKNNFKIFKDSIFFEKISNVISICFENYNEGDFEIYPLDFEQSKNLNRKYYSNTDEINYVYIENKDELTDIIAYNLKTVFYLNLIVGDSQFYLLNNLSDYSKKLKEIIPDFKQEVNGLQIIYNNTIALKIKINSFSIYDFLIVQKDDIFDIISLESKIKYFKNKIMYYIITSYNDTKILLKLLTPENEVKIYNNKKELFLNSNNLLVYLYGADSYIFEGNNSVVGFYIQLNESSNYLLCDKDNQYFKDVKEIFILPNKTQFDSLNIIITILNNNKNNNFLEYIIDYNILPYARLKFESFKRLLINDNNISLLMPNFYKDDKSKHLSNEKLFIFLRFNESISEINIKIDYMDYYFLYINEKIILSSKFKKVFLDYDLKYYVYFDLCENLKVNYNHTKNGKIIPTNKSSQIYSNEIIYIENNDIEKYSSLEIYSDKEMFLSLSNTNNYIIYDIIYNDTIDLKITDYNKREIYISFSPISYYPHVEYLIYLIKSEYINYLNNNCSIYHLIEDNLYLYKSLIISNGEDLFLNQTLKLTNVIEEDKEYVIMIICREILNSFPQYKFYQPYKFKISNVNPNDYKKDEDKATKTILIIIFSIGILLLFIIFIFIIFIRKKRMTNNYERLKDITSEIPIKID